MNKYSRIVLIILIFIYISMSTTVFANPEPGDLVEPQYSSILLEPDRGQILQSENSLYRIQPTILCKLMASLIVMENSQLDSKVTISKNVAKLSGSNMTLTVGNQYSVSDLLYIVMLSQNNDACLALSEYVGGGDIDKFVSMMNQKAKTLGMEDTYFVNSTGLYSEGQYTTAQDVGKFIKYALANVTFNNYFGTKGIPWLNGNDSLILTNQNKLFWSYDGVDGGKIGSNTKGTSILTTATKNGRRLITFVFASDEKAAIEKSKNYFDYGFNNFYNGILVAKNAVVRKIEVSGLPVELISKIDVYYTFPIGESYIESISFKQNEKLVLPITTDVVVGVMSYRLKDGTNIDVNLFSNADVVAAEDYKSKIISVLEDNRDLTILVLILIIVEICLVIYHLTRLISRFIKKTPKTQQ